MVDNVAKRREPLPNLSGVYFIQPSESSLNALINDFKGAKAPYKTAHVFFSTRLDPRVAAAFKVQAPAVLMSCLKSMQEVRCLMCGSAQKPECGKCPCICTQKK